MTYDTDDQIDAKAEYTAADLAAIGAKWLQRIKAAEKAEEHWFKDAEAAQKAYLADSHGEGEGDVPDFNILFSNVETIVPSIYNSTPVPDIRPRHNNRDDLAKLVSEVYERAIAVQIDDNRLDTEIERLAQDAFMAGRGVVRLKFDADVDEEAQVVTGERIDFEVVSWCDYRQGMAKRWKDVPWVAYRHFLSAEDLERAQDARLVALQGKDGEDKKKSDDEKDCDTPVWEIWCKTTGRVYFIAADNATVFRVEEDPLNLKGFFPQAEPVQPIGATNSLVPVCPYMIYRSLAEELDEATKRINVITSGLKVRGLIAGSAEAVTLLMDASDNELVPVPDLENIAATGGLDKAIMWWPLETAIAVLQQLYGQREQTKQAIYEITGISDIIRGQSSSAETATAQQIKTQWGSLRIKKMQRAIERQIRDIFVISADIISQHFSVESLQRMCGMEIPQEAMELLQKPLDSYRINVESDSTVRADLTRGRQEMSEFLNGTASYFSTMAPIVQSAPQAAGELIEIYTSFARQFSLGKQAEDALERLGEVAKQAATQPPPNPQAEAAAKDAEAKQAEMQMKSQEAQANQQAGAAELQLKRAEVEAKIKISVAELGLKERELAIKERQAAAASATSAIDNAVRGSEASSVLAESGESLAAAFSQSIAPLFLQVTQQMAALAQDIQAGNAVVIEAMTAPKEIVRDAAGRATGVRPMVN